MHNMTDERKINLKKAVFDEKSFRIMKEAVKKIGAVRCEMAAEVHNENEIMAVLNGIITLIEPLEHHENPDVRYGAMALTELVGVMEKIAKSEETPERTEEIAKAIEVITVFINDLEKLHQTMQSLLAK